MKRFPSRSCSDFEDDKAAFILSVLDPERALDFEQHLVECERCRLEVALGSSDIDALMLLAPEIDPPAGFEDRVLSSIAQELPLAAHDETNVRGFRNPRDNMVGRGRSISHSQGAQRSGARHKRLVFSIIGIATIAIGSFLVGGSGVGRFGSTSNAPKLGSNGSATQAPLSITLDSARSEIGSAAIYQGKTAWMVVDLTAGPEQGYLRCRLVERNGSTIDLGRFAVSRSQTSWATPLPPTWRDAKGIEIIASDGKVVARSHVRF